MNIFNNLQDQYEQLWKFIIRPTRSTYPEKNLGPQIFELEGKKIKRIDFQLINPRGYVLFCSHFIPLEEEKYPCVIYMHGNSSNRTQGMQYLGNLMRQNISLCTFDFSGCGNSEGQYVSLGYYQQDDLNQVVQHIRHRPQTTQIAIWGRSMGAVTGLLYMKKSKHICAAVFDSPFKSLKSLIEDLCKKNSKIPNIIITGALKIIAGTIQQKAKFDIYKLNPLKHEVPFLNYPVFFIVGMQDDMIPPEHTIQLYEKYKGQNKVIEKIKGNHNGTRPQECVQKVLSFLLLNLRKEQGKQRKTQTPQANPKKQQQFNFFDDQNQVIDSSKQTQNIDFFSEDPQVQKKHSFEVFNFQNQYSQPKKNQPFSISSMLFSVFSGTNNPKKQYNLKRAFDGYEMTIERISGQIFIQDTADFQKGKQQVLLFQEKKRNQITDIKSNNFQKQIIANLQTWAF